MKKIILALVILLSISPASLAREAKSAVTDKSGDPVRSTNGNCVRHDWQGGTDICAPAPIPEPEPEPYVAPAPEPEPEPVALLTRGELTIYFDFAKSDIPANETAKLNKLIEALIASEGVESLSIVGYADRIGSDTANLKLSQKRTKSVQDYLNARVTIPTEIVQADAKGEANSVTNCDKKQKRKALVSCLAADRRVEIVLNYFVK